MRGLVEDGEASGMDGTENAARRLRRRIQRVLAAASEEEEYRGAACGALSCGRAARIVLSWSVSSQPLPLAGLSGKSRCALFQHPSRTR